MSGSQEKGALSAGRLGIVLASVALVAVAGLSHWQRASREPVVEAVQGGRLLPTLAEFQALRRQGEFGANSLQAFEALEDDSLAARVGTIRLDLEYGNFKILPGSPGEGVRITGTYEPDAFRLEEQYEEADGAWLYQITFGAKGGTVGMVLSGAGNQPQNDLTITLPPDLLFDLKGEWGIGKLDAELGGLWLRTVDLQTRTGDHRLAFSLPTQWPVRRLEVDKGVGELAIRQLGNASAQFTSVQQSIGSARVDLGGAWLIDGEVQITSRVGELGVDAPDRAYLEVAKTSVWVGESVIDPDAQALEVPLGAPTVNLRAELGVGELRVRPPREPESLAPPEAIEQGNAESDDELI
ncbi:MAG: hypothetical protein AAGA68_12840 [Pseudomonadota bacterium]